MAALFNGHDGYDSRMGQLRGLALFVFTVFIAHRFRRMRSQDWLVLKRSEDHRQDLEYLAG